MRSEQRGRDTNGFNFKGGCAPSWVETASSVMTPSLECDSAHGSAHIVLTQAGVS